MRLGRLLPLTLLACILLPGTAFAVGWQARLNDQPHAPEHLVAVDKSKQTLYLLVKQSPLAVETTYTCTTGQIEGDKKVEGDKKTPEGVYFVRRKIASGLDQKLYGGIAYTLNYPNPIDKLRAKTGHGIWVHGRGSQIVPRETQGCVAMNNTDLAVLGEKLTPGTPVILAHQIIHPTPKPVNDHAIHTMLVEKTHAWAAAWANRSENFFNFYDANAYTKANSGSFTAFARQKRQLFRRLSWIINWVDNIHVIQGPGYWVTSFDQFYRAPNLTVQGNRRLYWIQNDAGELAIAGMEWHPQQKALENKYIATISSEVSTLLDGWKKTWLATDATAYAQYYTAKSTQGSLHGQNAIRRHKENVWKQARPESIDITNLQIRVTNKGLVATFIQKYKDNRGYADAGRKKILLRPVKGSWRIAQEDWRKL